MKQSILVLGADEFIGRKVLQGLAATDWAKPIAAVRRRGQSTMDERLIEVSRPESVRSAMEGVAAAVNCISGSAEVIVSSAKAVFEAAAAIAPAMRVVHISSMTVYGTAVGSVAESAPLRGDLGPYSAARVAAEAIAASYPRVVIFRPGCEFGPGSDYWGVRIARCLLAGRLGDLGAGGDGYCNLIDIENLVDAVIRALASPHLERGVFNLGHPDAPTWNDFLTRYAIALRAVPVRRISARRLALEGKVLAPPMKAAEILARLCRVDARFVPTPIPPSLLRVMRQEIRLDTRRVETELGLRWKDLDASVAQTARWMLESEGA